MGRNKIANEKKNCHDNMLCNGHDIGARNLIDRSSNHHLGQSDEDREVSTYFKNLDALFDRGVKINMVGAHASSNANLQVLCLLKGVT